MNEKQFVSALVNELSTIENYSREKVYSTFSKYVKNHEVLKRIVSIGILTYEYPLAVG